jgi:hypothetical protein
MPTTARARQKAAAAPARRLDATVRRRTGRTRTAPAAPPTCGEPTGTHSDAMADV